MESRNIMVVRTGFSRKWFHLLWLIEKGRPIISCPNSLEYRWINLIKWILGLGKFKKETISLIRGPSINEVRKKQFRTLTVTTTNKIRNRSKQIYGDFTQVLISKGWVLYNQRLKKKALWIVGGHELLLRTAQYWSKSSQILNTF